MRLPFWSRLVAGWVACWLPLVLADGGWLHACPMHDGPVPAAVMAMAAAPGGHAEHGAAHAAAHGAHANHGDHDAGSRHAPGGHCCTCLGACCAALAVLPVRPAPLTLVTVERAYVAPMGRPEHEYVAAWVDFVLPYSTAPPEAAAA